MPFWRKSCCSSSGRECNQASKPVPLLGRNISQGLLEQGGLASKKRNRPGGKLTPSFRDSRAAPVVSLGNYDSLLGSSLSLSPVGDPGGPGANLGRRELIASPHPAPAAGRWARHWANVVATRHPCLLSERRPVISRVALRFRFLVASCGVQEMGSGEGQGKGQKEPEDSSWEVLVLVMAWSAGT